MAPTQERAHRILSRRDKINGLLFDSITTADRQSVLLDDLYLTDTVAIFASQSQFASPERLKRGFLRVMDDVETRIKSASDNQGASQTPELVFIAAVFTIADGLQKGRIGRDQTLSTAVSERVMSMMRAAFSYRPNLVKAPNFPWDQEVAYALDPHHPHLHSDVRLQILTHPKTKDLVAETLKRDKNARAAAGEIMRLGTVGEQIFFGTRAKELQAMADRIPKKDLALARTLVLFQVSAFTKMHADEIRRLSQDQLREIYNAVIYPMNTVWRENIDDAQHGEFVNWAMIEHIADNGNLDALEAFCTAFKTRPFRNMGDVLRPDRKAVVIDRYNRNPRREVFRALRLFFSTNRNIHEPQS